MSGRRDYVIVGARRNRAFDYPPASDERQRLGRAAGPAWTGTTGIKLDTTLSRLLFAFRFRDLNLLISDQITGDSQLLFHRSLSDRLGLIAPFLRFDKDPYLVVTSSGRLVYVQDAYTISDRFPNAQSFDASDLGPDSGLANDSVQLHPEQRQDRHGRLRRDDDVLRRRPDRPDHPGLRGRLPVPVQPDLAQMPADLQAHLRVPGGAVQRPDDPVRDATT